MPSIKPRSTDAPLQAGAALRLLPGSRDGVPGATRASSLITAHQGTVQTAARPLPFDADLSRTLAALGGADGRRRIHALHPSRPGDEGAATGFAFVLLSALAGCTITEQPALSRPLLWVQDRSARAEAGRPYGLGFPAFGFDPSHVVLVSTKGALEALAAVEIGLEIGGLAGVLVELPPALPADMLALGKRLALRAERSATPCLLLHASRRAVAAPVATRWEVASLPAVSSKAWEAPLPVAGLDLVKNRFGPTGRWSAPLVAPIRAVPASAREIVAQGVSGVCIANRSPSLSEPVVANAADRSGTASILGRERAA